MLEGIGISVFLLVAPPLAGPGAGRAARRLDRGALRPVFDFDVPPKLLKQVKPKYPKDAFKKKIEGVVRLEFAIETNGEVRDVRVLRLDPRAGRGRNTHAALLAVRPGQEERRPRARRRAGAGRVLHRPVVLVPGALTIGSALALFALIGIRGWTAWDEIVIDFDVPPRLLEAAKPIPAEPPQGVEPGAIFEVELAIGRDGRVETVTVVRSVPSLDERGRARRLRLAVRARPAPGRARADARPLVHRLRRPLPSRRIRSARRWRREAGTRRRRDGPGARRLPPLTAPAPVPILGAP